MSDDLYKILKVMYLGPETEEYVKEKSKKIKSKSGQEAYQKGWIDCTLEQSHLLVELYPYIQRVLYETNAKRIIDAKKQLKQKIEQLW